MRTRPNKPRDKAEKMKLADLELYALSNDVTQNVTFEALAHQQNQLLQTHLEPLRG